LVESDLILLEDEQIGQMGEERRLKAEGRRLKVEGLNEGEPSDNGLRLREEGYVIKVRFDVPANSATS
jgi:hypothetical protein